MKKKKNNLRKDLIKRHNYIKVEIKKIILKSIIQNLNLKPLIRGLALKKLSKMIVKSSISRQNNNICLKSGRYKGVLNTTNLGRHEMKKLGSLGYLQNIKISSW